MITIDLILIISHVAQAVRCVCVAFVFTIQASTSDAARTPE